MLWQGIHPLPVFAVHHCCLGYGVCKSLVEQWSVNLRQSGVKLAPLIDTSQNFMSAIDVVAAAPLTKRLKKIHQGGHADYQKGRWLLRSTAQQALIHSRDLSAVQTLEQAYWFRSLNRSWPLADNPSWKCWRLDKGGCSDSCCCDNHRQDKSEENATNAGLSPTPLRVVGQPVHVVKRA